MKKAKQYVLCFMFIVVMALAAGCGTGNGADGTTGSGGASGSTNTTTNGGQTSTQPSTSYPVENGQSREGGAINEPTNNTGTDGAGMESTGVIDGLTDGIRNGAEDLMNGAEGSVTGTTAANQKR